MSVPPEDAPEDANGEHPAGAAGVLDWARRESGDLWLRPWRLTPERLATYAACVRAIVDGGPAVNAEDPAAVLDADRQPVLRPWEFADAPDRPAGFDPARAVAALLAARPALAAAVQPHMALGDFAAAHLRLLVGVQALVRLFGVDAAALTVDRLCVWADAAGVRGTKEEEDFVASLATIVGARAHVDGRFVGV